MTQKKDLLVYVADADAGAFIRAILLRSAALSIRDISFDIERHPGRDCGMVQSAAELVRMKKHLYDKVLLVWDHHGSGREHRQSPTEVTNEISEKLDRFTWSNNHTVIVLVPELEQWLWSCGNALVAYYKINSEQLEQWKQDKARNDQIDLQHLVDRFPKELFEFIVRERIRRTISPSDFRAIGERASLSRLESCPSFVQLASTLRSWFPRPA